MIKQKIEYLGDDGQQISGDFYFNLTKIELLELDADYNDNLVATIKSISAGEKTSKQVLAFFKDLVGRSYGERTESGKFIKSEELTAAFVVTDAYSELLMSIFQDATKAATFIEGLMPADIVAQVKADRAAEDSKRLQQNFVQRANDRVEAEMKAQYTPPTENAVVGQRFVPEVNIGLNQYVRPVPQPDVTIPQAE